MIAKGVQSCLNIKPSAFLHLKQYPNKPLLSKSKTITFDNNTLLFQQRCALLTEICYMLLKIQIQKTTVYLSRNLFINHNHLLFMMFTFDSTHETKMKKITHGALLTHIIEYYALIFVKEAPDIEDYEQKMIFGNTKDLINYLTQRRDQSQKYYFGGVEQTHEEKEKQLQLNNPYSILIKLQKSQIFQQFSYFLKFSKAVLIKIIINSQHFKSSNILQSYNELVYLQSNLFGMMNRQFFLNDLKDTLFVFQKKLFHFFKLIQAQNYIQLVNIEQQARQNSKAKNESKSIFQIDFCSNLRKLPCYNKTSNERSSQSSAYNNNGETPNEGEKQQSTKQKQQLERLNTFKNQINFKIKTIFHYDKCYFTIQAEGISQWALDQYYYNIFHMVWSQFVNNWYNSALGQDEDSPLEESMPFKLELFQKHKNIGIREVFIINKNSNIIKQIIATIDRIDIVFILFQNILKNMYKITQNIIQNDEKYLNNIRNKAFIQNLIKLHKHASKQYAEYYNELTKFQQRHLQM